MLEMIRSSEWKGLGVTSSLKGSSEWLGNRQKWREMRGLSCSPKMLGECLIFFCLMYLDMCQGFQGGKMMVYIGKWDGGGVGVNE